MKKTRILFIFAIVAMLLCLMTFSAAATTGDADKPVILSSVGDTEEDAADVTPIENEAGEDAADAAEEAEEEIEEVPDTPFYSTWWALLPPLIAIILALITKEVYSSLFVGIL